jgi:hypothetical protein
MTERRLFIVLEIDIGERLAGCVFDAAEQRGDALLPIGALARLQRKGHLAVNALMADGVLIP